jgi:DNA invertase Pin-like site-specific DNA recombinase
MYRDEEKLSKHPREFWERIIDQWVLDEQARYSIKRCFLDHIPYEKVAEELKISRLTVFNKIKKYAPIVFEHCGL